MHPTHRVHTKNGSFEDIERHSDRVQRLRQNPAQWLLDQDASRLVFNDESGSNGGMARQYARAPVGQRIVDRVLCNYGGPITLIGALTLNGLSAVMTVEGGTDTNVFEVYVAHVLIREINPADVVVLDNRAAHKG